MLTVVIASLRTDASAMDGTEVSPTARSTWLTATRQTLWEACRRRLHRTGSAPGSTPSRTAGLYGMLVASDVSRYASSVPP